MSPLKQQEKGKCLFSYTGYIFLQENVCLTFYRKMHMGLHYYWTKGNRNVIDSVLLEYLLAAHNGLEQNEKSNCKIWQYIL